MSIKNKTAGLYGCHGGQMEKLGDLIKHLRVEKGITQKELAVLVGAATSSISNYENGHRKPPEDVILAIAEALEVPEEEFLSCMEAGEDRARHRRRKIRPDSRRPRRVRKLLAAFYRLSDEAQAKAIGWMEDFSLIPKYQKKIADALREYASSLDHLDYKVVQDVQVPMEFEDGMLRSVQMAGDIEHIILQHMSGAQERKQRDFFYCTLACEAASAGWDDFKKTVSGLMIPEQMVFCPTLVFDDESVLDRFYDCYEYLREQMDMSSVSYAVPDAFWLVEKGTWEILEVQDYD